MTEAPTPEIKAGGWLQLAANVIIVLFIAYCVLDILMTWHTLWRIDNTEQAVRFWSPRLFHPVSKWVRIGMSLISLTTFIVILAALYRTARNANALSPESISIRPGMFIGSFFIPVVNLFRPLQTLREVWKASQPGGTPLADRPVAPLINIWWGFWLASGFLGYASIHMEAVHGPPVFYKRSLLLRIIASLIAIGSVLAIQIILNRLFRMQRQISDSN
ncbi:DUF4328 domain-containing protein [Calycomorphotria hydatis]|uniref:DUF4328 domain-containing protein n=1 Tax=Calycomorphotria hydatis TaxID=2528027 RepID=A0A517TCX0_9PLAN|nr:DUF4328 domain-containing protein [Calycomorphotria hydatis]QDT66223.1 hypothetical protein V22_34880 [Calycomorphotria hydatis]